MLVTCVCSHSFDASTIVCWKPHDRNLKSTVTNVCFLLSCRNDFCKYVEYSIKYLLSSASFGNNDKTIMYRRTCVNKMWLCNLCTFATRPIKVLFSYFNAQLIALVFPLALITKCKWRSSLGGGEMCHMFIKYSAGLDRCWPWENICSSSGSKGTEDPRLTYILNNCYSLNWGVGEILPCAIFLIWRKCLENE